MDPVNLKSCALRVAGTVFGLFAAAQLLRVVTRTSVILAGKEIPIWISVIAMLIGGALSIWMWVASRR